VRPGHVTGFLGPNGAGRPPRRGSSPWPDDQRPAQHSCGGRRYQDVIRPVHQIGSLLGRERRASRAHPHGLICFLCAEQWHRAPRVAQVLEMIGLDQVAGKRVRSSLSGMKQRWDRRGVLGDPPILMFDEPVNGLDPEASTGSARCLKALAQKAVPVFVSSHFYERDGPDGDHLIIIGAEGYSADTPQTGSWSPDPHGRAGAVPAFATLPSHQRGAVVAERPSGAAVTGKGRESGATAPARPCGCWTPRTGLWACRRVAFPRR